MRMSQKKKKKNSICLGPLNELFYRSLIILINFFEFVFFIFFQYIFRRSRIVLVNFRLFDVSLPQKSII